MCIIGMTWYLIGSLGMTWLRKPNPKIVVKLMEEEEICPCA
jgi:hypothetical protein